MLRPLPGHFWNTLALAFAVGVGACSATNDEFLADNEAPLEVVMEADGRFVINEAESPERVLVCPPAVPALEDESYKFPDDYYYPDVIDAELSDYPELAAAVGASRVETCEQARAWTANRLALVEGDSPLKGTVVNLSSDMSVVDKILNGLSHVDDNILQVRFTVPVDMGPGCSAVAISPFHLLTSAHCVPPNDAYCGLIPSYACSSTQALVYRTTAAGSREVIYYTTAQTVITYKHENYGGAGDPGDDIALVELPGWNYPTSKLRPLGLNAAFTTNYMSGWGTTSNTTITPSRLKRPPADAGFFFDGYASNFTWFYDNNDNDVNLCRGDSGSPSVEGATGAVNGIASMIEGESSTTLCRTGGYREWWTEVPRKLSWIETRLPHWGSFTCPPGGNPCCARYAGAAYCYP